MNLYPNPTAPLIPLYPKSPVAENRQRQNLTCAWVPAARGGLTSAAALASFSRLSTVAARSQSGPISCRVASSPNVVARPP